MSKAAWIAPVLGAWLFAPSHVAAEDLVPPEARAYRPAPDEPKPPLWARRWLRPWRPPPLERPRSHRPFCGGVAGIPCPAGSTCIDDARDSCDPERGGADCGGVCVRSHPDRPPGRPPAPPDAARCGANVCGAEEYCCNESCGICAPLGGACTLQVCPGPFPYGAGEGPRVAPLDEQGSDSDESALDEAAPADAEPAEAP